MMLTDSFATCLAFTLHEEGGFGDDPKDPGGATNLGVTKETWEEWVGYPVSIDDIRALTVGQVTPLYRARFWQALACDRMAPAIALCVFDFGVNSGDSHAARELQTLVAATPDGQIGPATLAQLQQRVMASGLAQLIQDYDAARLAYLQSLPEWPHDGDGWEARVKRATAAALALVR